MPCSRYDNGNCARRLVDAYDGDGGDGVFYSPV